MSDELGTSTLYKVVILMVHDLEIQNLEIQ